MDDAFEMNGYHQFEFNPSHNSNGFIKVNPELGDPSFRLQPNLTPVDSSSSSSTSRFSEAESPDAPPDTSNTLLKFISQMLMDEEDLECDPCMYENCLALHAAEKPFYDVLNQKYPLLCPPSVRPNAQNPDVENFHGKASFFDPSLENLLSSYSTFDIPSIEFSGKGVEEAASKLSGNGQFEIIDSETNNSLNGSPHDSSRGKKSHQREEDSDDSQEGRNNKQSETTYSDDYESENEFDKVLLYQGSNCSANASSGNVKTKKTQLKQQSKGSNSKSNRSNSKSNRSKKRGNDKELVDLWTLLTQSAQAVASYDQRNAKELLNQIRKHSSPYGDGTQRLAHYFAKGLEARLYAGSPLYMPLAGKESSSAEILRAYKVFITACPFKRMANFMANRTILSLAKKTRQLHIIDFGILYGYQWPCLIQHLSYLPGGPPKLRITGIELPQPGFRPAEGVEKTRRRLESYCKRFQIPFECIVIAQKWETVRIEDLKLERDEVVVVNCLGRLKNIPDETVVADSPRDKVLKLIKKIKPDLFVHGVVNGTYNAPFFDSRFREALFHYSAFFDLLEATVPLEDQDRLTFERQVIGRDIINVIACEGLARVERPETYKQWQIRNQRAGFRQIGLDRELLDEVRGMVRDEYHADFVVDEDKYWMLQGWKGRIICALSCWVPA